MTIEPRDFGMVSHNVRSLFQRAKVRNFHPLTKHEIRQIVDLQRIRLQKRLEDNGFTLEITDAAKKQLAEEGDDSVYDARPLKRVIQQRLQNELANTTLGAKFEEGSCITIDVQNGDFTFGSTS